MMGSKPSNHRGYGSNHSNNDRKLGIGIKLVFEWEVVYVFFKNIYIFF